MQKNTKVFHLSQILAVHVGVTLLDSNEIRWDQNTQYFWGQKNSFDLLVDVVEHVSGQKIMNPKSPVGFEKEKLSDIIPYVRDHLITEMPWLIDVEYDMRRLVDKGEERQRYVQRWVESVSSMAHGEFFRVSEAYHANHRLAHDGFPDLMMN